MAEKKRMLQKPRMVPVPGPLRQVRPPLGEQEGRRGLGVPQAGLIGAALGLATCEIIASIPG
jgi:hypothetical protein